MRFRPVTRDFVVTSGFGPRWGTVHRGNDYGVDGGSANRPVFASQTGKVVYAGAASGFGGPDPAGWVVVDHPAEHGGGTTVYGHVIREVAVGDIVQAGQRIGRINPDSRTNGGVAPHLHFEVHPTVWRAGSQIDPGPWLLAGQGGMRYPAESVPAAPEPVPGSSGTRKTRFGVDISNWQRGISVERIASEGFEFLIAKVSEGTAYRDPTWPVFRDAARANGLRLMGYHYFRPGDVEAQADTFVSHLGDKSIPAMIDFEHGSGTSVRSIVDFKNALAARGVSANLLYLPRWYWQGTMGSPDLTQVGMPLMSSSYGNNRAGVASSIYPGDNDSGWNSYGGLPVAIFQFSERGAVAGQSIDVNAFKGTEHDLDALFGEEVDMAFTDDDRRMLRTVHDELTKRFPSRSKYRSDNELVDSLAGFVLNTDARTHEESVEREARARTTWAVELVRREADRGDRLAQELLKGLEA